MRSSRDLHDQERWTRLRRHGTRDARRTAPEAARSLRYRRSRDVPLCTSNDIKLSGERSEWAGTRCLTPQSESQRCTHPFGPFQKAIALDSVAPVTTISLLLVNVST